MTKAELLADREALASLILEAVGRLEAVAKEPITEDGGYARAFGRLEMSIEIEAAHIRALLAEGRSR